MVQSASPTRVRLIANVRDGDELLTFERFADGSVVCVADDHQPIADGGVIDDHDRYLAVTDVLAGTTYLRSVDYCAGCGTVDSALTGKGMCAECDHDHREDDEINRRIDEERGR